MFTKQTTILAIIGPNGAGKSSMLNVINGVYTPQEGTITFHGEVRKDMDTHQAAENGIARTFQNIALFTGMSVLDNIMTGRNLKIKSTFIEQAFWFGRARREEIENRKKVEEIIDFFAVAIGAQNTRGALAVRHQETCGTRTCACRRADDATARRTNGWDER